LPLVDAALIYDNSGAGRALIAEKSLDAPLLAHDPARWALIEEAMR